MLLAEVGQVKRQFTRVETHVHAVLSGDNKAGALLLGILHVHDAGALAANVLGRQADTQGIANLPVFLAKGTVKLAVDGAEKASLLMRKTETLGSDLVNSQNRICHSEPFRLLAAQLLVSAFHKRFKTFCLRVNWGGR